MYSVNNSIDCMRYSLYILVSHVFFIDIWLLYFFSDLSIFCIKNIIITKIKNILILFFFPIKNVSFFSFYAFAGAITMSSSAFSVCLFLIVCLFLALKKALSPSRNSYVFSSIVICVFPFIR